ncbi:MAG: hypothetical protein ACFFAE_15805 [Candidatus Hodarchaeota archaeon]
MQNSDIHKQKTLSTLKKKISRGEIIRILFVCSGNIMRSPIGEMLFEKMIQDLPCHPLIKSESGAVVYRNSSLLYETRQILLNEGVSEERIDEFYPRHITNHPQLFQNADLILVMEFSHFSVLAEFGLKSFLLKDFTLGISEEISDPYFGGSLNDVTEEIKECLEVLKTELCDE